MAESVSAAIIRSGLRRPKALPRLLLFLSLLSSMTACGVDFQETFTGTEMFKAISLAGDRTAGSELTLTVTLAQPYPVPVEVTCYYEDGDNLTDDAYRVAFHERAKRIGGVVLPPATATATATPASRQLVMFDFSVPQPGNYFLACLTPAAADNGLGLSFKIKGATTATSTPR